MRAVGVIAEYNPLHLGHLRQLAAVRQAHPDRGVIVCLSGNYVQRGEPAVFSKYARAEAAVTAEGGADLVLELQTPFAMARAQRFATEGVKLLAATGVVDILSFGAECGDAELLTELAASLERDDFSLFLKEELAGGSDFASARQRAAARLVGEEKAALLREPNNILAVEYLSAIRREKLPLRPLVIRRTGAAHDAPGTSGEDLSASALRTLLLAGETERAARYITPKAMEVYRREMEAGRGPMSLERLEPVLLGQLRRMTPEDFACLPDLSEGLENRLYEGAAEPSFAAACAAAKTKRYSLARIRRLYLSACLGLEEKTAADGAAYLRVLAMNARGRELLREMRETAILPVVTKPSEALELQKKARRLAESESLACDLYRLGWRDRGRRGDDLRTSPVVIN